MGSLTCHIVFILVLPITARTARSTVALNLEGHNAFLSRASALGLLSRILRRVRGGCSSRSSGAVAFLLRSFNSRLSRRSGISLLGSVFAGKVETCPPALFGSGETCLVRPTTIFGPPFGTFRPRCARGAAGHARGLLGPLLERNAFDVCPQSFDQGRVVDAELRITLGSRATLQGAIGLCLATKSGSIIRKLKSEILNSSPQLNAWRRASSRVGVRHQLLF
mmetsp:Transcript_89403/g.186813  ORF Transcript_89403/g.186813 Transcript_89403/m.186813 type:complete len:222 (-) Transcript_89403:833-1498(-)